METFGVVKTCKFVTSNKFQTVELLNNGLVRTSGLSLCTHDLHVDVESAPKLFLDLHVVRSLVDNLDNVARSQILITQLRNRPNSSILLSCQTILAEVEPSCSCRWVCYQTFSFAVPSRFRVLQPPLHSSHAVLNVR